MPRKNSYQKIIDERRQRVSALLLRGLNQREITEKLAEVPYVDSQGRQRGGMVNPKTGKPFDLAQIHRDIKALSEQWQASAARDIAEIKAEQLAEIKEAKRHCWATRDITNLIKLIHLETKIVGTLAPTNVKLEVDWRAQLTELGLSPSEEYEQLVQDLAERYQYEFADQ